MPPVPPASPNDASAPVVRERLVTTDVETRKRDPGHDFWRVGEAPLTLTTTRLPLGTLGVMREEIQGGVRMRGQAPRDRVLLTVFEGARVQVCGRAVRRTDALQGCGGEVDLLLHDARTWHVTLTRTLAREVAQADPTLAGEILGWFERPIEVRRVTPTHVDALCRLIDALVDMPPKEASTLPLARGPTALRVLERVLDVVRTSLPPPRGSPLGRPPKRRAAALAAEKLALEAPSIPLGVLELAQRLGVSTTTLEAGFKEQFGEPPSAYLRRLRLRRAHQQLRAGTAGTTVTATALRFGFEHLGRFAAEHRKAYGETPSQTLARCSRGRPPG